MNATRVSRKLLAVAGALLLGGASFAQGRYYSLLHHFAGGANDGARAQGSLVMAGSTLYGMTSAGGSSNLGTVFKINADGTGFAVLHSFAGVTTDGSNPYGSLTLSGTTLYGMTYGGGYGRGTLFRINTDGTGYEILHFFEGYSTQAGNYINSPYGTVLTAEGSNPYGSLTSSGSTLYGMTYRGGSSVDLGTVFRINVDGTGFTVLHSFDGASTKNGAHPYGSLTLVGSVLYGMANASAGSAYPGGVVVFKLNTDGTGFAILAEVNAASANGSLTLAGSTLYGMATAYEGPGGDGGPVFKINTDGTGFAVLYSFGWFPVPQGSLVLIDSTLYGMTSDTSDYNKGTIFQISTDGTNFATRHYFAGGTEDGATPYGSLLLNGMTLYGMTSAGGSNGLGVIFALPANVPLIGTQPFSQSVVAGGSATFSVTATGVAPLSYQWQRQAAGGTMWSDLTDGAVYTGTGTDTLTVTSVTTAMSSDFFRCIISNGYGDAISAPAALVVPVPLTVTTLAGQGGHSGGGDGPGSAAQFSSPADVAADAAGNVDVADTYNHTIRKITQTGVVSTVAGYTGASGSVDGTGAAARFNHPSGVTVDAAGNIFAADTDNHTIRKISPTGAVTTLAGQAGASGASDGTGSAARFNSPSGLAVDSIGNLYVADTLNHTLRKVTPGGVVTTLAGNAGAAGATDATGTAVRFYGPQGLALDGGGNLYVADTNNCTIRRLVLSTGTVTTVAGLAGSSGSVDAPGSMARFRNPSGVTADGTGNLFVTDTDNNIIREISAAGVVSTIAGKASTGGSADGMGDAVRFQYPGGICIDGTGNLYIADTSNQTIRLGYYPGAPAFTTQPQSQTVMAGTTVQFSVTTTGKPAPTLQWYCNGAAISGATGSTLNLSAVQSINAGDYTVTATNTSGTVTSNRATLTVNAVPSVSTATAGGGGGGGGSMELWFVLGLLGLAVGRRMAADCRR